MSCEQCRPQLLPFLYDLLDPHEREATAAHLESCPECQEALKTAREQQGMLAEAVKEEHPEIVFKAPSKNTPASTAPTVALQRPRRRFFLLNRWAAAASILFLLLGAGSVVGWSVWRDQSANFAATQKRLAKAKDDLSRSQNDLHQQKGQTQKDIRKIQQQIDTLFNSWKTEETKTRKVLEEKGAQLIIKGPQVARAGANNNYEVQVRQELPGNLAQDVNKDGNKGDKGQEKGDPKNLLTQQMPPLQVRALNQKTGKTVFEQQLKLQANNQANFVLPSNVANKPGEEIALQFQTSGLDGKLLTWTDNLNLVFPEYVTHLATDRPLYRPGDTVRFRSLTLERFSLKPAQQKFHLRYRIVGPNHAELYNKEFASSVIPGPNQEPIKGPRGEELNCLGGGEFTLPATLAGGQYTLYVGEVNERFNEEKRTFLVHRWQAPRFNKEVQFQRNSYGAGDQLKMQVRVVPVKAMPAGFRNNLQISVRVVVDGVKVMEEHHRQVDNEGRASFECNLPNQIHRGVGKVTIECEDAGPRETLTRDIPLVVRDMQVEFYPEGGDLIAGVPNRVYFQARTPANRPAEFSGRIVDGKDREVARVQTLADDQEPGINQGLGSFTFTPQVGKYRLRIDSPIGIERTIPLPTAKAEGVVLHLPQELAENEIDVRVRSVGKKRDLLVGAYCRGRMLDAKEVTAGAGQTKQVILRPMAGVAGVYRITVFEKIGSGAEPTFVPLAERLIYRQSAETLDVAVTSDRPSYQPGDPVRLTLQARNEKRAFVPALAMVAVVDTSLLKWAGEKTARGLPTHFLLTTEIRNPEDLESADVLLGSHPKASVALDLLLGCQGWRRFAEQDPLKFQRKHQQAQPPIFLANTDMVTQFLETEQKQIDKLDQGFVKEVIDLEKKLAENEKQEADPAELKQVVEQKQSSVQAVQQEVAQAERRQQEIRGFLVQFGLGGGLLALLFLGFYFVSVGLRHLGEGTGNPRAWLTAGVVWLGMLFLVSVIGAFALMGENLIDDFRDDLFAKKAMPFPKAPELLDAPPNLPDQPEGIGDEERLVEDLQKAQGQIDAAKKREVKGEPQPARNAAELEDMQNERVANFQADDPQEDRQLRQQGRYQALLLKNLGRRVELPPVYDPCVVREYAHQHKAQPGDLRRDFSETLCWQPALVMPDGKAQLRFDLSDSVTRFQVLVLSHTFDGRLGANRIEITSKLPFRLEPMAPPRAREDPAGR
jgi:hypothetical protein